MASSQPGLTDQVTLSADIVAAYVVHNSVPASALPGLIHTVHDALMKLGEAPTVPEVGTRTPAVSVRKSVTPEYLICLDDGKKFKSLKKHIGSLGMTPDQYRTKWGLPESYPMVAPNYAAVRSALAKQIGLGQLRRDAGKGKSGRKPKTVAETASS